MDLASDLMAAFLARGRRYLWTDAFAVCNLFGAAQDARALELVTRVHRELGRSRDPAHPTLGGLRIGKRLPERAEDEPYDPDLEWDRDGQYFHYLTKWMHALDVAARRTGRATLLAWARELAWVAHRAFVHGARGRRRMVWKKSVDLTRVLVPSMGLHDPLDGLVTCRQLDATSALLGVAPKPRLDDAIDDFLQMLRPEALATSDPLGIGGVASDAWRLAQLGEHDLVSALVGAAVTGLEEWMAERDPEAPADRRLAFRELGLAIGLTALARVAPAEGERFEAERASLVAFWSRPTNRRNAMWREHEDIDDVMLATALRPDGFLELVRTSYARARPHA